MTSMIADLFTESANGVMDDVLADDTITHKPHDGSSSPIVATFIETTGSQPMDEFGNRSVRMATIEVEASLGVDPRDSFTVDSEEWHVVELTKKFAGKAWYDLRRTSFQQRRTSKPG